MASPDLPPVRCRCLPWLKLFLTMALHFPQVARTGITATSMLVQEVRRLDRGVRGRGDHGNARSPALRRLRPAARRRVRRALLAGRGVGNRDDHGDHLPDSRVRRIFLRRIGAARSGAMGLRGALGRGVSLCRPLRGISISRLRAIHARHGNRILAGGHGALRRVRRDSSRQPRRRQSRRAQRVCDRNVFLPDACGAPATCGSPWDCTPPSIGARRFCFPCRTAASSRPATC